MNEVIDNIHARRSVRRFADTPIPRDVLETVIGAGNMAPSGNNVQNWRFVVVEDAAFRGELMNHALPVYEQWMKNAPQPLVEARREIDAAVDDPIYYGAPAVVFVVGSGMTADFDTPMVCENMMLAARSLGIGSCWVYFGSLPLQVNEIRERLGISEDEKVYGPIVFGYPGGDFPEPPSKKEPQVTWL